MTRDLWHYGTALHTDGETEIPVTICIAVIVTFAVATIGLGGYMFKKAKA